MRVLVCGGRDFTDANTAFNSMSRIFDDLGEPSVIIHGGAPGADTLAGEYADVNKIPTNVFRAAWRKHGKAAGPIRNQRMIDEGKPDVVIAFKGGRGTADMIRRATEAGVPVHQI